MSSNKVFLRCFENSPAQMENRMPEHGEESDSKVFTTVPKGVRFKELIMKITVEPVLLLFMSASFLSFPTAQFVLSDKICHATYPDEFHNSSICDNLSSTNLTKEHAYVQGETSLWILYVTLAYLLPSVLVAAFVGSWSDVYGKKHVLLMPFIGSTVEKIVFLFGVIYAEKIPIWFFLFGSVAAGCSGGFVVALQTSFSYLSDITTHDNRSTRIAVLESMTFFGSLLGNLFIVLLLGKVKTYILYVVMLLLYAVGIVYILFRIKNVIPPHGDASPGGARMLCDVRHVRECYATTFRRRDGGGRGNLILLLLAMVLFVMTAAGERDVSYLFVTYAPLDFAPSDYGYYQTYYYSLVSISLITVLPLIRRRLHWHDMTICGIGGASKLISFIILSFSVTTWMVYTAVTTGALSLMAAASIRAAISKIASPDEQGKVFAVLASIESASGVVATSIFNPIFKSSLSFWPGLCYMICAVIMLVMICVALLLRYRLRDISRTGNIQHLHEETEEMSE